MKITANNLKAGMTITYGGDTATIQEITPDNSGFGVDLTVSGDNDTWFAFNGTEIEVHENTKTEMLIMPTEMKVGDNVVTIEHGWITLTETPTRTPGATNTNTLTGTNTNGNTVHVRRSAFKAIRAQR